jgi:hypothetical protein
VSRAEEHELNFILPPVFLMLPKTGGLPGRSKAVSPPNPCRSGIHVP